MIVFIFMWSEVRGGRHTIIWNNWRSIFDAKALEDGQSVLLVLSIKISDVELEVC